MRALALVVTALVALATGCTTRVADGTIEDPLDGGLGIGFAMCETAADCALAATTCCACPTFALPADDPRITACEEVGCNEPSCPANVAAACVDGTCALACAPLACNLECTAGFALDADGCLACACATPDDATCGSDADCHEVPADCCGCAAGGSDTAVEDVAAYEAGLACGSDPACPGGDACDAAAVPRCVGARCTLLGGAPPGLPANACGRPDLAACPDGEVCVVNADPAAEAQGLGTCQAP